VSRKADSNRPSLNEEARATARGRILRATADLMAAEGTMLTIDDVAEAAGVGRRTVFRYFGTLGQLLAAGLENIWMRYASMAPQPPAVGQSLEDWLAGIVLEHHDRNATVLGEVFWDIWRRSEDSAVPMEMRAWQRRFAKRRHQHALEVSTMGWHAVGGVDEPPDWVTQAFALHLSAFATNGYAAGGSQMPQGTARVSARVLEAVLHDAVEGKRSVK